MYIHLFVYLYIHHYGSTAVPKAVLPELKAAKTRLESVLLHNWLGLPWIQSVVAMSCTESRNASHFRASLAHRWKADLKQASLQSFVTWLCKCTNYCIHSLAWLLLTATLEETSRSGSTAHSSGLELCLQNQRLDNASWHQAFTPSGDVGTRVLTGA